jgi:hypothetical protein
MAIRNVGSDDTFEQWREKTNNIALDVGDMTDSEGNSLLPYSNSSLDLVTTVVTLKEKVEEKEDIGVAVAMAIALGG